MIPRVDPFYRISDERKKEILDARTRIVARMSAMPFLRPAEEKALAMLLHESGSFARVYWTLLMLGRLRVETGLDMSVEELDRWVRLLDHMENLPRNVRLYPKAIS